GPRYCSSSPTEKARLGVDLVAALFLGLMPGILADEVSAAREPERPLEEVPSGIRPDVPREDEGVQPLRLEPERLRADRPDGAAAELLPARIRHVGEDSVAREAGPADADLVQHLPRPDAIGERDALLHPHLRDRRGTRGALLGDPLHLAADRPLVDREARPHRSAPVLSVIVHSPPAQPPSGPDGVQLPRRVVRASRCW